MRTGWFKDGLATVLVVVLGFFAVGRIGGAIPYGWTASLVSGGLYVALLVAYGLWTGPGRRSGTLPFMVGGMLLFPALVAWFFLDLVSEINGLSPDWPKFLLGQIQVGGSLRRCGAWDICGPVWWVFMVMMIGVVVLIRNFVVVFRKD